MHFPTVPPPPPKEQTPEDLLGHIPPQLRATVEYNPASMVSPKDYTARLLMEDVVYAHQAIGGREALALWGHVNRSKFYTSILAKMLPLASSPVMEDQKPIVYRLSVPVKTALDITDVTDVTPEAVSARSPA